MYNHFHRKGIMAFLLAITCCLFCVSPEVSAVETQDTAPINIIETAGMNGYYEYDLRTDEETFVPPSDYAPTSVSSLPESIPQDLSDPSIENLHLTEYYEDNLGGSPASNETITPEIEPFSVIGADDRVPVGTIRDPYTNTCLIVSRFPDGSKDYGTGFIVNDYYVATAGHLAYKANHGGYADHFAVYVGANNGTYKRYSYALSYKVGGDFVGEYEKYISEYGYNFTGSYEQLYKKVYDTARFDDWAIIECDTSLDGLGHLGIKPANSAVEMLDRVYYTQGYPGPLNEDRLNVPTGNTENLIDYWMYTASGEILGDEIRQPRFLTVVSTDIDIERGQSGSPVYTHYSDSGYTAQAIVISESYWSDTGEPSYNSAILINDWLCNIIMGL